MNYEYHAPKANLKTPNPKHQTPNTKHQTPNPKAESRRAVIQAWRSGAAWCVFRRMVLEKGLRRYGYTTISI